MQLQQQTIFDAGMVSVIKLTLVFLLLPFPQSSSHTTSSGGESKDDEKHYSLVPSRIELSKNFSIISMENIPLAVEGSQASDSSAHYP